MKRKLKICSLFFLGLCLVVCASSATILPKDKQYAEYFIRLHAAELFRTKSFVLDKSWAYVSANRLERVEMRFSCYKVLSVNQARKLIVDVATELLEKINADSKMKEKHLVSTPFTVDRLKIEIKTSNVFSRNSDVTSVRVILLNNGQITYETYTPSSIYHGSARDYKETFQYALMLLDDPALIDQVDAEIRDNWKKKEWQGEMYPPEQPLFKKPVAPLPIVMLSPFVQGIPLSENRMLLVNQTPFVDGISTHTIPLDGSTEPTFFAHDSAVVQPLFDRAFPTTKTSLPVSVSYMVQLSDCDQTFFDISPATVVYGPTNTEDRLKGGRALSYGAAPLSSCDDLEHMRQNSIRKVILEKQGFPYTDSVLARNWMDTSSWIGHNVGRKATRYTEIVATNALLVHQKRHHREVIAYESTLEKIEPIQEPKLYALGPKHHPVQELCIENGEAKSFFFDAPSDHMISYADQKLPESSSKEAFQEWFHTFLKKGEYAKELSENKDSQDTEEVVKEEILEVQEDSDAQSEVSVQEEPKMPEVTASVASATADVVPQEEKSSPADEPDSASTVDGSSEESHEEVQDSLAAFSTWLSSFFQKETQNEENGGCEIASLEPVADVQGEKKEQVMKENLDVPAEQAIPEEEQSLESKEAQHTFSTWFSSFLQKETSKDETKSSQIASMDSVVANSSEEKSKEPAFEKNSLFDEEQLGPQNDSIVEK